MDAYLPQIVSIIRDLLRDELLWISVDTRFEDLFGWDSMDLLTVVTEVECRLDLQFTMVEIDRLDTVGDLLVMISAKRALTLA